MRLTSSRMQWMLMRMHPKREINPNVLRVLVQGGSQTHQNVADPTRTKMGQQLGNNLANTGQTSLSGALAFVVSLLL